MKSENQKIRKSENQKISRVLSTSDVKSENWKIRKSQGCSLLQSWNQKIRKSENLNGTSNMKSETTSRYIYHNSSRILEHNILFNILLYSHIKYWFFLGNLENPNIKYLIFIIKILGLSKIHYKKPNILINIGICFSRF